MNVIRRGTLRWLGNVLGKDENSWVRKVMDINIELGKP